MSDLDGPRRPRRSELGSLVTLLETCFSGELPEGVLKRWPHVLADEREVLENTVVVAQGERIVSAILTHPVTLVLGGGRLSASSVCFVATDPAYRGHGLMARCIDAVVALLRSRGAALSWLIGDRVRYGRYGWENAMQKHLYVITARSVATLPDVRLEIRDGAPEAALLAMHEERELRVLRDRKAMKMLLTRARKHTLVAFSKGRACAYVVFERPAGATRAVLFEHGGTPAGVGALLRACFEREGISELIASSPVGRDPARPALVAAASTWRLDPGYIEFPQAACHMVKILDLAKLLRGFAAQMQARRKAIGDKRSGRVSLGIEGTGQLATLELGARVRVTEKPSPKPLWLGERQMVRFLFGTARPDEEIACPPLLRGALPLDLFVSPLEDT